MVDRRRTFGPTVALGVLAAGLSAYAGGQDLAVFPGSTAMHVYGGQDRGRDLPLLTALSLVVLAAWGVLLVTRGRLRRFVAALGALAAAGGVVTVAAGISILREALPGGPAGDLSPDLTGWFYVSFAAALSSLLAATVAVLWVRSWPEMGTRDDRPADSGGSASVAALDDDLALWKALDEGRDPSA
jgi:hypothetical protein